MPQRNVTITPHQERFIETALQSGQFDNTNEISQAAPLPNSVFSLNIHAERRALLHIETASIPLNWVHK